MSAKLAFIAAHLAEHAVLTCDSPKVCPGGPGSHSEYEILGFTEKISDEENIMSWTLKCAQQR